MKIRDHRAGLIWSSLVLMCLLVVGLALGIVQPKTIATPSTITSIGPSSGPATGGQTVTITGTNFKQSLGWKQIAVAFGHTCAIADNSQVYCWGSNGEGRLGNGSFTIDGLCYGGTGMGFDQFECEMNSGIWVPGENHDSLTPTAVSQGGMPNLEVEQVSAGYSHTCIIASNGQAYCWGSNLQGELGNNGGSMNCSWFGFDNADNGMPCNSTTPVAVHQGEMPDLKVKQISASSSNLFTCAIASNDQVYCWGNGTYGQLGNNNSGWANYNLIPIAVHQGEMPDLKVKQISIGNDFACTIASNDEVY